MATLARVTALWTGFQGSPGYSRFYWQANLPPTSAEVEGAAGAVSDLFTAIKNQLPTDVRVQVQSEVEYIDEATGQPVGKVPVAPQDSVAGTRTGSYSAPTGFCMHWPTGVYVNGRAVTGTTYIVPAAGPVFDSDGSINSTDLAVLQTAADTFATTTVGIPLAVWSRPTATRAGSSTLVVGGTVPDKAVVLRSRRD